MLSENQRKGCQNFRTFDYCSIFLLFLSSQALKDFKPTRSAKFSTCFHRSTLKLSIKVVFPFLFNQYFLVFSQPVIVCYISYSYTTCTLLHAFVLHLFIITCKRQSLRSCLIFIPPFIHRAYSP